MSLIPRCQTLFLFQVLVAVLPEAQMQYFDVDTKKWTPLSLVTPLINVTCCCYVESVGIFFVAGRDSSGDCIYFYDIERNMWERQPHNLGIVKQMCTLDDFMYAIMHCNQLPQRFSFSKRQWQSFAKVSITSDIYNSNFYNSGTTVLFAKVYVLYGNRLRPRREWCAQNAKLHCFDPEKNEWEVKVTTCKPHFGSILFVVNSKLYVAGGYVEISDPGNPFGNTGIPCGNPAPVEVYNEKNNNWSVVEQKRIPPNNNLGAVEIEGKVYFIINKYPIDSGIRISPGEVYPVPLDEWENLGKIDKTAVLCYLPVKRESLKTE